MAQPPSPADPLQPWTALVLKDGVSLGGLPLRTQQHALALVWSALAPGVVVDERGINIELRAALAGPACWLDTDHVELRRWLVDAGWLQRDGYGREYRRVPWEALAPQMQSLSAPLRGLDTAAWVSQQRTARQQQREARRHQWQATQAQAAAPSDGR